MAASQAPSADMDSYLSPYMTYTKDDAAGAPRAERALTRIYAPYWGIPNLRGRNTMGFPNAAKDWQRCPFLPTAYNVTPRPSVESAKYIDPDAFLDWQIAPPPALAAQMWVPRLCRIGCGLQYLLGMNVFTGERFKPGGSNDSVGQAQLLRSPQALALYHKSDDQTLPAFNSAIPPQVTPAVQPAQTWPVLALVAGMSKEAGDLQWVPKCCGDNAINRDTDREIAELTNAQLAPANLTPTAARESEFGSALLEPEVQSLLASGSSISANSTSIGSHVAAEEKWTKPVMTASSKVLPLAEAPNDKSPVGVVNKPLGGGTREYTNASSLITLVPCICSALTSFNF
jgi:hypothetical protein